MAHEKEKKDAKEKVTEKVKEKTTARVEVSHSTSHKDTAKVVTTPTGFRHQDPKNGKFREKVSPASVGRSPVASETKIRFNESYQAEKGGFKAAVGVNPTADSVGIRGKLEHTIYKYKGQEGNVTLKSGSLQGEAAFGAKGFSVSAEVNGPSISASTTKKFCIGKTVSINTDIEGTVGVGVGGGGKVGVGKNKTNHNYRVNLEGKLGTGVRLGGKVDAEINTKDDSCTPSVMEEQTFPNPRPNSSPDDPSLKIPAEELSQPSTVQIPHFSAPTPHANRTPASMMPEVEEDSDEEDEVLPTVPEMRADIFQGLTDLGVAPADIESAQASIDPENLVAAYRHVNYAVSIRDISNEEFTQRQIEGCAQAFDFLRTLGGQLRCEPLIKGATVGKHLLAAYETYAKISKTGLTKFLEGGVGAVLGGIATFGASFLGIIGAFIGGGPDPTQLILEAIQGVSDQIRNLSADMHECFRQQSSQQENMYKQMMKGFDKLSFQIENGTAGIRIDIATRFDQLESQMDFMMLLVNKGQQALLMQPLTDLCDEVEDWRAGRKNGNPQVEVPRLANKLFSAVKSRSTNELLNGQNLWAVYRQQGLQSEVISKFLQVDAAQDVSDRSVDFNWFLSFLASYAEFSRAKFIENKGIKGAKTVDYRPLLMPNPLVLHRALESYVVLKHAQPIFDNDPSGKDLMEIEVILRRTIKFMEDLKSDDILFQSLVFDYYEALKKVRDNLKNYAAYESEVLSSTLNADYAVEEATKNLQHGLPVQAGIKVNLLEESPEQFIAKFAARGINKIHNDVTKIDTVKNEHPQYSKKRLYANASAAKDAQMATLCAGEYLKLWSFSAAQSCASKGRSWKGEYYVRAQDTGLGYRGRAQLNEGEEFYFRNGFSMIADGEYPWISPLGDRGIGRRAAETNTHIPPALSIRETEWTLDFDLKVGNEVVAHLTFREGWLNARDVSVGVWADALVVRKIQGGHYMRYGGAEEDFQNELIKYIFEKYNLDGETVQCTLTPANVVPYRTRVENELFKKRQELARNLLLKRATGNGQAHVDSFRAALLELDKVVTLIKWYGVLAGKDLADKAFKNLVTSKVIDGELKSFTELASPDFVRKLSPTLSSVVANRETQEPLLHTKLVALQSKAVKELSKGHPRVILERSLQKLEMYQQWKKIFLLEFPELLDVSLEEHHLKCQIFGEQIFQETTHALLREINQKSYNKARFQALNHMNYSKKMQPATYGKVFDECVRFTSEEASHPVSTGREVVLGYNLDDIKTQQWLFKVFRSGAGLMRWAPNIGFLMGFIAHQLKWKDDLVQPVNFIMWSDGILTLLRLLFNEKLEDVSQEAGYELEGKIKALSDCLSSGLQLKKLVYNSAVIPQLFESLFAEYHLRLGKFKKWLGVIASRYPNNDAEVYRQFKMSSGNYSNNYLDGVASRGVVLLMLIEMLFEHEIVTNPEFKMLLAFTDRDGFWDYLREKAPGDYEKVPLMKRLELHEEKIKKLRHFVLQRTKKAKQHYEFWVYLQNYFKNNKKSHEFLLTQVHLDYIKEHGGQLITTFLNMHRQLTTLKLGDVRVDAETVDWVAAIVTPHQHIDTLALSSQTFYEKGEEEQLEKVLSIVHRNRKNVPGHLDPSLPLSVNHRQRSAALMLDLELGPIRLQRLIALVIKAQKSLTKRLWAERGGYQLSSFEDVNYEQERDVLMELEGVDAEVRAELEELVQTQDEEEVASEKTSPTRSSHYKGNVSPIFARQRSSSGPNTPQKGAQSVGSSSVSPNHNHK